MITAFFRKIAVMRSSHVAFRTLYITQPQEEHGVLRTNYDTVTFIYIIITYTLKEHGMFLKKHYEIPFLKECAVLFPP